VGIPVTTPVSWPPCIVGAAAKMVVTEDVTPGASPVDLLPGRI
jgi:hypothetical protein